MTLWRRENPESDEHAELIAIDKYVLGEGKPVLPVRCDPLDETEPAERGSSR